MNREGNRVAVLGALTSKIGKDGSDEYNSMLDHLQSAGDAATLRDLFYAIGQNAAVISKHHKDFEELLALLFGFNWSLGNEVADAFETIVLGLVSSNAGFLEPVFQLIVQNFYPPGDEDDEDDEEEDDDVEEMDGNGKGRGKSDVDGDEDLEGNGNGEDDNAEFLKARSERLHQTIQAVLRIIPLGCSSLLPVIMAQFPRHLEPLKRQTVFMKEALTVCDYVPVLRDRIIAQVLEHMLKMDMEINLDELETTSNSPEGPVDLTCANPDVSAGTVDVMFDMDDDQNCNRNHEQQQQQQSLIQQQMELKQVRELAEKLDQLMDIFCAYSDKLGKHQLKSFFSLLLNLFEKLIMPRKQVSFAQFIVFYVCRKRGDFVDALVERLLERSLGDYDEELAVRTLAIKYLASFLARGLYVKSETTASALGHMMDWIQAYVQDFEKRPLKNGEILDPREHGRFIAVCEAVVYIVMFKGGDLGNTDSFRLDVIMTNRIRPFIFFSQDLREEFQQYAKVKGLIHPNYLKLLDAIIVQTERKACFKRLSPEEQAQLLSSNLYPFDPCLLKRTATRVDPFYQHWLSSQSEQHVSKYEICDAEIENNALEEEEAEGVVDENDESELLEDESLLEGSSQLPPPIAIRQLSDRAARMLSQLGGGYLQNQHHHHHHHQQAYQYQQHQQQSDQSTWSYPQKASMPSSSMESNDNVHSNLMMSASPSSISTSSSRTFTARRGQPIPQQHQVKPRAESVDSDVMVGSW